jgi:hypothetical protein
MFHFSAACSSVQVCSASYTTHRGRSFFRKKSGRSVKLASDFLYVFIECYLCTKHMHFKFTVLPLRTTKIWVKFYQTMRCRIPEDCNVGSCLTKRVCVVVTFYTHVLRFWLRILAQTLALLIEPRSVKYFLTQHHPRIFLPSDAVYPGHKLLPEVTRQANTPKYLRRCYFASRGL